jgi:hypothetical protein
VSGLTSKRVIVAGASSGIGCAAAEAFAREGADVARVARSRDGLEVVAERVRAHGSRAHAIVADLGTRAEAERAVEEAVAGLGGLDVLVWNAASMVFGRFADVAPEDFDRTLQLSFHAAVDTIRAEEIAQALVNAALRPRAEFTIGLEYRAIEWLFQLSRPIADRLLVLVAKYYASGREPAPSPGGLWAPSGTGRAAGGLHGRPSLWRRLRGR